MEPVSAFGIAVNVLQLVDFCARLLREAREINQSATGQKAEHIELRQIAKSLSELCDDIPSPAVQNNLTAGQDVSIISQSAKSVAEDLLATIEKLSSHGDSKKPWRGFKQVVATLWNKDKIADLQRRLGDLRAQLQANLVVRISTSQNALVGDLKALRKQCETVNPRRLNQIHDAILQIGGLHLSEMKAEILHSVDGILKQADAMRKTVENERMILESLQFDSMFDRYHTIIEAHQKTFDWIFEPYAFPPEDPRSNIKFQHWLTNGTGIFWVAGKPGSGKSTLMRYLCDCPRTRQCLQAWAGNARLATAAFYFWMAGTELQRSQRGLLRQLLYEILRENPDLISSACQERWREPIPNMTWRTVELYRVLERLESFNAHIKFCFFIDGLDEYTGDHADLIDIIKRISRLPNIKLCVSSRPWPRFVDSFGSSPDRRLYLEVLTRNDIRQFAQDKLSESPTFSSLSWVGGEYVDLVEEITNRAQGVFLWVFLVVRSLRDGLSNGDNASLLRQRLDEIPTDLEEFFEKIIKSVDTIYKRPMALTFQVALRAHIPINVITYWLLDEASSSHMFSPRTNEIPRSVDILQLEADMSKRLIGRYKGLLEAGGVSGSRKVNFLHRTVRDYLQTNIAYKLFVVPDLNPCTKACAAFLAYVKELGPKSAFFNASIEDFIVFGKWAELQKENFDSNLISEMYRELQKFGQGFAFLKKAVHYNSVTALSRVQQASPKKISEQIGMLLHLATDEQPSRARQLFGEERMHESFMWLFRNNVWEYSTITLREALVNFLLCPKQGLTKRNPTTRSVYQGRPRITTSEWQSKLAAIAPFMIEKEPSIIADPELMNELPFIGAHHPSSIRLIPPDREERLDLYGHDGPVVLSYKAYFQRNVEAHSVLLRSGLDPNQKIGSHTLWQIWLWYIAEFQTSHGLLEDQCVAIMNVFLEHGANIDEQIEYDPNRGQDEKKDQRISVHDLVEIYFEIENSKALRKSLDAARRRRFAANTMTSWEDSETRKRRQEGDGRIEEVTLMGHGKRREY